MYQLATSSFGKFEQLRFYNKQNGNAFTIVPNHGACLLDLTFNHQSIIDGYDKVEDMCNNDWGKNIVLFPFPNRLKDGQYTFEGKSYQFPINDNGTNNALHGFGMFTKMNVKEIKIEENFVSVTCLYNDLGQNPAYPFPFSFEIKYTINNDNEFNVQMKVVNTGLTNLPMGFGWHPYFKFGDKIEEVQLQFPSCHKIEIDDRMIPTGERTVYDNFAKLSPIGDTVLDNCFAMNSDEPKVELILSMEDTRIHYWQELGKGKFNYLQLFTPPYRSCIAVEPMTCNIDAFNNGDGLIVLTPNEKVKAKFGLKFEETI